MERTKRYPECFPGNFETEILPKGAKEESRPVYRVMKSGTIDREGFISTYEEIQRGLIPPKKKLRWNRPEIYSTSCNMDYSEAQYALESTSQPLGISSYELSKLIPEEFKGSLPTIEEIEAELKD